MWDDRIRRLLHHSAKGDWSTINTELRRFAAWQAANTPLAALFPRPLEPVEALYQQPVLDLGANGNAPLNMIFSPIYDPSAVAYYLHSQFTDHAETYQQKYENFTYFRALLMQGLAHTPFTANQRLTILDIGCGAGNTTIPLIDLFPEATLIASDFSIELLILLRRTLLQRYKRVRCGLMQLNAEELDFAPASFDLVVGGAILHHLFAPEKTLIGCKHILKPGGYAIFYEPFENGSSILRLIFKQILHDSRAATLPPEVVQVLTAHIIDIEARRGSDKSAPYFPHIDDKWLFTTNYFRDLAAKLGFRRCLVLPIHSTDHPFSNQIQVYMQLGTPYGRDGLPAWAWEYAAAYDDAFSPDLKAELLIEGCVILER